MSAKPMTIREALKKVEGYTYYDLFEKIVTREVRSTLGSISNHDEIPSAKPILKIIDKDYGAFQDPAIARQLAYGLVSTREELVQLIAQVQANAVPHVLKDTFLNYLNSSLAVLDAREIVSYTYDHEKKKTVETIVTFPYGHTHVSYYKMLVDNLTSELMELHSFVEFIGSYIESSDSPAMTLFKRMHELSMDIILTGDRSMGRLLEIETILRELLANYESFSSAREELEAIFDEIFSAWLISEGS